MVITNLVTQLGNMILKLEICIILETSSLAWKHYYQLGNIALNLKKYSSTGKSHFEIHDMNVSESKNYVSKLIFMFRS